MKESTYRLFDHLEGPIYSLLIVAFYILYIATFVGILYINPAYLREFYISIQVFIASILIIRFNPFQVHVLRKNDSNIIFTCAIFILVNAGLTAVATNYFKKFWKKDVEPDIVAHLHH